MVASSENNDYREGLWKGSMREKNKEKMNDKR